MAAYKPFARKSAPRSAPWSVGCVGRPRAEDAWKVIVYELHQLHGRLAKCVLIPPEGRKALYSHILAISKTIDSICTGATGSGFAADPQSYPNLLTGKDPAHVETE